MKNFLFRRTCKIASLVVFYGLSIKKEHTLALSNFMKRTAILVGSLAILTVVALSIVLTVVISANLGEWQGSLLDSHAPLA